MNVLIIEPFYTGSHRTWVNEWILKSKHQISTLTLSGNNWKWHMHGAAVTLSKHFNLLKKLPDIIVATDMLDVSVFLALTRKKTQDIPIVLYMHENQLTYPVNDNDKLHKNNFHYGFINYTSALSADNIWFNSNYHHDVFINQLGLFLKNFPDHNEMQNINEILEKSTVMPIAMDLQKFKKLAEHKINNIPIILWNHRWEYDKNPNDFFKTLSIIRNRNIPFKLMVMGSNSSTVPPIFEEAKVMFSEEILFWGMASRKDYELNLKRADILPVTSNQDFFGISAVEGMYCGCYPLLPDRLVFPEHIPTSEHDNYLYHSFENMVEKLSFYLKNYPNIPTTNLDSHLLQYDWQFMTPKYDLALEMLILNK